MRQFKALLALPSTLLSLILCCRVQAIEDLESPALAQHKAIWKRDQDALALLAIQEPQGIRKMSEDPGEKFWVHYWDFGDQSDANLTSPDAALALHSSQLHKILGRALIARDASCPSGYSSCASIGHSDSCCPSDNTCILVTDTGNGPVGCCAAGKSCGTTVPDCNTSLGYTSCPDSTNKGCCIPGYACSGNICVNVGTMTITPAISTTTTTTTTSTSSTPLAVVVTVTTLTVTSINTSGYTTTATVTVSLSPSSSSSSITTSTSTSTTTATVVAPVRPTTDSTSDTSIDAASVTTTSTVTTSATSIVGYCPTGYYMCSAVYLGGCCQVDRDCNTTSCPSTATTSVITGEVTVVAPTGASSNAGNCPTGWYSCPASVGGLCCPSGYGCGQTNCPASTTGIAAQAKQAPSQATGLAMVWIYTIVAVTTAIGMVML